MAMKLSIAQQRSVTAAALDMGSLLMQHPHPPSFEKDLDRHWVAQGEFGDLASKKGNRNTHESGNEACDSTGENISGTIHLP